MTVFMLNVQLNEFLYNTIKEVTWVGQEANGHFFPVFSTRAWLVSPVSKPVYLVT